MIKNIAQAIWHHVSDSFLANIPVTIQKGPLRGLRWTLAPVSGYWRGVVETDIEREILASELHSGAVVWDLGAHFGYFAFLCSTQVGDAGKVFCFEPDPQSFKKLCRHIAMNQNTRIKALPLAVSDQNAYAPLIQHEHNSTVSHLPYPGEQAPDSAARVKTATVDSLVAEKQIAVPTFVKIDVEGHGGAALRGGRQTIGNHKPTILISVHSQDEIDASLAVLVPLGYRAYSHGELVETPLPGETYLFRATQ